ncbi:MAG: Wzz/FepE/Etk N-terminal domain-containing protein, partial [Thiobacillaceae bacterium]|nr:Wzz/FepE/Etk N-terminal domain-containing protein [Thiobacillaceae bacterium]
MQETLEQLLGYLRGVWRRRWLALIVAWVVTVVGWVWIYFLQNEYQAQARVYVDTQSLLRPLLSGLAVQPNMTQQVEMMTRTLVSRPNLEKIARMTDLDLRAKDPKALEELYNDIAERIQLSGTTRENLYTIGFTHANPDLGKRVVQALLTLFTESSLGGTRKDLSNTQKFIEDQLKSYEAKLLEKEKQLEEFKRRNVGQMPGQTGQYYARLQEANTVLRQAKLEMEEALNRKKQLQQQLADQEETISTPVAPSMTAGNSVLDGRITALQTQLDNLRLRFTDMHPEILRTKQLIASLQDQKRKEAEAAAAEVNSNPVAVKAQNPVYQQLSIAIAESDAQVAALKARVRQFEQQRDELMRAVDTIPQLEAELTQLTRDYDVYKSNYAELLARRETASLSGEVESKTDVVDFRVIDPPRVPSTPASPNRPLLISLTPVGGLGFGIALAFVLAQLRPTVDTRRQLRELTGLQPLGAVSRLDTDTLRRRKRRLNWTFALAGGGLVVAYGVLMTYYLVISPAA